MQLARATTLAGTPATPAPPMPALTLAVPAHVDAAFDDALVRARRDTAAWLEANPDGTAIQFRDFILEQAGTPPTGDAARADYETVRSTIATRTPRVDEQVRWIDEHGLFVPWDGAKAEHVARVGAEQAKAGLALLQKASELTGVLTFPIKDRFLRPRPFQQHPELTLLPGVTHVSGGSFPSGHASLAFAQAAMLGALVPDRAEAYARLAAQLSFSRTYAAAHFPSDVVLGAYVGQAAASFVQARPDAQIPARDRH